MPTLRHLSKFPLASIKIPGHLLRLFKHQSIAFFAYAPAHSSLLWWTDNLSEVLKTEERQLLRNANIFLRHTIPEDRFLVIPALQEIGVNTSNLDLTYRWKSNNSSATQTILVRGNLVSVGKMQILEGFVMDLSKSKSLLPKLLRFDPEHSENKTHPAHQAHISKVIYTIIGSLKDKFYNYDFSKISLHTELSVISLSEQKIFVPLIESALSDFIFKYPGSSIKILPRVHDSVISFIFLVRLNSYALSEPKLTDHSEFKKALENFKSSGGKIKYKKSPSILSLALSLDRKLFLRNFLDEKSIFNSDNKWALIIHEDVDIQRRCQQVCLSTNINCLFALNALDAIRIAFQLNQKLSVVIIGTNFKDLKALTIVRRIAGKLKNVRYILIGDHTVTSDSKDLNLENLSKVNAATLETDLLPALLDSESEPSLLASQVLG